VSSGKMGMLFSWIWVDSEGDRKRESEEGRVSACWVFLNVVKWERMLGHLIAADFSSWRRASRPPLLGRYSSGEKAER